MIIKSSFLTKSLKREEGRPAPQSFKDGILEGFWEHDEFIKEINKKP